MTMKSSFWLSSFWFLFFVLFFFMTLDWFQPVQHWDSLPVRPSLSHKTPHSHQQREQDKMNGLEFLDCWVTAMTKCSVELNLVCLLCWFSCYMSTKEWALSKLLMDDFFFMYYFFFFYKRKKEMIESDYPPTHCFNDICCNRRAEGTSVH